jgi:type I restriction enzyme M protein
MSNDPATIVNKVWNYAHVLRDVGLSYLDYVEQITFLLFLKMAQEQAEMNVSNSVSAEFAWPTLTSRSGDVLEVHYRHILENLGKQPGLLGTIFRKAQNKIQEPAQLERIIRMIDGESWMALDADVKGAIYEGLLERGAADTKSGAGQYFTPRPLIRAIVECMRPRPDQTIVDPACGTGGFLLAAHDYIVRNNTLDKGQAEFLQNQALHGTDIVEGVTRLCAMNLLLHGIGGTNGSLVDSRDSLALPPGTHYDMVLTNPPFGKKSSITIVGEDGRAAQEKITYERDDFWATTSNKQLNFLQHVHSLLKMGGTAAIVVPDNVLFEGGAGETIRKRLLAAADVHTLLRLPTGIFYSPGVKANVLFFDRKPASDTPWTNHLWIYDLRTNQHFTLKTSPLRFEHLEDFIRCFNPANRNDRQETERFHRFSYDDLMQRDKVNLDIFWLKDESLEDAENLPPPAVLAAEIVDQLEAALEEFRGIEEALGAGE